MADRSESPRRVSSQAPATLLDVARAAGVGLATASRALAGRAGVAETTRTRVRQVAEQLGYRANPVARAFGRRRTHILELIVPVFTRYLYFEILRGVVEAIAETDYSLVIRPVERAADLNRVFAECCNRGRVDGVLITSCAPTASLVEGPRDSLTPVVLVDADHPGLPSVGVDHEEGAAQAVRHCVRLGHRRIALVDRPEDPFSTDSLGPRQGGYRRAMAEAGLPTPPEYQWVTGYSPEAAMAAIEQLLALPEPPTAVIAGSDMQAMGALGAARRRRLAVPRDLSIVGYNDVEPAEYLGLTTVRVPMRELGRRGAELLLRAVEVQEPTAPPIRLPTSVVIRETCGPPPPEEPVGAAR